MENNGKKFYLKNKDICDKEEESRLLCYPLLLSFSSGLSQSSLFFLPTFGLRLFIQKKLQIY